ncbi:MAG: aspartate/glutamate racemase family protein [Desulfatiglandales bacterium]|nr:aspartate/glutamate racemase family protein [Desulfatiglandales bacterium]
MIGWKARFGVILPSVNTTTESEFYRCMPEGVTAHFTRMEFKETTPEYFEGMINDVPSGARMLSHAGVDAILFACTSGSLYGGLGYDQKIISKINKNIDVPASTTSTSVVEAFKAVGIKKVAVATPYEDWVNDLEKKFFEKSGVQVLHIQGLGLRGLDVCEVHPETLYRFARAQDREEADALFLSCMGLRTLEILPRLEQDLGKPVFSSNQVTLWMLFRLIKSRESNIRCDFGSLFKEKY